MESEWRIIKTKSNAEKKLALRFQQMGYPTFLPTIKSKSYWKDRIKEVELVLIKNYLFVQTHSCEHISLSELQGASRFLTQDKKYAVLKDEDKSRLEKICDEKLEAQIYKSDWQIGEIVRICKGALMGEKGYIVEFCGKKRVLLHLDSLGLGFIVKVALHYLEKID